ncbi:hypothetical protein C4D60_Mb07t21690 [Musa balbisiana]|uniref:MSP domain-containing protein n=1 Tax=Musa balbisiana TaxID=52838 RepID=A0A4S8JHQ8_MUSBA|nr:hypothetical protein C4D60_Mb07t21690 [Musa balbisiana]
MMFDCVRLPTRLSREVEVKRQSSCCMQLTNKTDNYVAFKVKTTSPKKYSVRPNMGIVQPRSAITITVTMQAQKEAPPDYQSKDKFLIQSVIANDGATTKDITAEMFNKAPDKVVEEFKLRVVYMPANPPSPVPEESEEGISPRSSMLENKTQSSTLFDAVSPSSSLTSHFWRLQLVFLVSRSLEEAPSDGSQEEETMISKLTEEKKYAMQQNKKLQNELFVKVLFFGSINLFGPNRTDFNLKKYQLNPKTPKILKSRPKLDEFTALPLSLRLFLIAPFLALLSRLRTQHANVSRVNTYHFTGAEFKSKSPSGGHQETLLLHSVDTHCCPNCCGCCSCSDDEPAAATDEPTVLCHLPIFAPCTTPFVPHRCY